VSRADVPTSNCSTDGTGQRPPAGSRDAPAARSCGRYAGACFNPDVGPIGVIGAFTVSGEAVAERAEHALPRGLVRDDEIVILLLRPSVLYVVLAPAASVLVILTFTLALALVAAKAPWLGWHEQKAWFVGGALIAARLGWQALDWVNRFYVLTDRRIITRAGVLRVHVFESQLRAIQHTGIFMRLRERLFGLGSIGFATAGSDAFDTFWLMVRQPFAVHRAVAEAIKRYGGPRM
jgi:hypothetical protein